MCKPPNRCKVITPIGGFNHGRGRKDSPQKAALKELYDIICGCFYGCHSLPRKMRGGGIVKRAVYIAIGIDMSGHRDVLGMYVGENESSKFWLSIINSLKNRGVEDILITCVDGLNGFSQAIEAVYPEAVRRLIYTTNQIEGFNRQLRKVTKSRSVFPSDNSLLKMLYLTMIDITKKWTGYRQDWGKIHSQLEIFFDERLVKIDY